MAVEQFDSRLPKALFERYLANFQTIGIDWNDEWKEWTRKNLGYFAELGKSQKYEVYWTHAADRTEYLVDLCWYVEGEQYSWMELAVEEEWNPKLDEILYDFCKLMDVKAYLKVFICFPDEATRSDLPSRLANEVSMHRIKVPEEAYLLIVFSRDRRRKQTERLLVEGFGIDYRGNLSPLSQKLFPDSLMTGS